jgi:hypothetical protein
MVTVPLFSPGLSRAWISLFTRAPRALVAPLVQSLRHDMVAGNRRLQARAGIPGTPLEQALDEALADRVLARAAKRRRNGEPAEGLGTREDLARLAVPPAPEPASSPAPATFTVTVPSVADVPIGGLPLAASPFDLPVGTAVAAPERPAPPAAPPTRRKITRPAGDVRSVQRLALPNGHDARWIADEYLRWLPQHLRFLLRVDITRATGEGRPAPILAKVRVRLLRRPLLELRFSPERSTFDRPLFYVTGGLLARRDPSHGRLEFREVSDGRTVLAALHDYVPRLPFALYVATQGLLHRLVMSAFGRHLRRLAREARV